MRDRVLPRQALIAEDIIAWQITWRGLIVLSRNKFLLVMQSKQQQQHLLLVGRVTSLVWMSTVTRSRRTSMIRTPTSLFRGGIFSTKVESIAPIH